MSHAAGWWKNLRCDVCGDTFDGFHKLDMNGDRCCPTCYALATVAGPGLDSPDVRDELQGDTPP